ncbi:MAG: TrkH family potassium uptake protein, partial [Prevotella sp.]|nr:TrkH family potassium uptake protein [Prevotella sp.]
LHPKAVLPVKINGQSIPQSSIQTMMAFFAIFILAGLCTATIMIAFGIDNTNAITISLSCMSNVGPSLGTEIGPVMSWSTLPMSVKWLCSLLMLMGRLEIFSVIVLFTPSFWKDN